MTEPARKICMLGDFGVGKTSLVGRFVSNTFSDKYLSTVGTKVDSKEVVAHGKPRKLVLWDIAGKSALDTLNRRYLTGASGIILVVDGTRQSTLLSALYLEKQAKSDLGELPVVVMVNKLDLIDSWEIRPDVIEELRKTHDVFETSARTGDAVERAFVTLAEKIAP